MKNLSLQLIFTFLLLGTITGSAQEKIDLDPSKTVIISLKSGSKLEGEVIDWKIGESITVVSAWGQEYTFERIHYENIEQVSSSYNDVILKPYNFKEKGLYYTYKMSFIKGNNGERAAEVNGFGISASAGHRFNRYFSIGGGVGYDKYIWNSGEEFFPVFVEFTGYLVPKLTTLFYNIQGGYSFAQGPEDRYLLSDAEGGLMFYPSIGVRFGPDALKITFDAGYKFQEAELTYNQPWGQDFSEQTLTYKRLVLRLGITL